MKSDCGYILGRQVVTTNNVLACTLYVVTTICPKVSHVQKLKGENMTKKGMDKERRLVRYLENKGYGAVRVAGSGAGTPNPRPDIVAGKPNIKYAIELKSSDKNTIYIGRKQVEDLKKFAHSFGSRAIICAWFTRERPCFLEIGSLSKTKGDNYKVSRKSIHLLQMEQKTVCL